MSDFSEHTSKVVLRVTPSRTDPEDGPSCIYQIEVETDPEYSDQDAEDSDDWLTLSLEGAAKDLSMSLTALDAERLGRALLRAAEIRRAAIAKAEGLK